VERAIETFLRSWSSSLSGFTTRLEVFLHLCGSVHEISIIRADFICRFCVCFCFDNGFDQKPLVLFTPVRNDTERSVTIEKAAKSTGVTLRTLKLQRQGYFAERRTPSALFACG